MANERFLRRLEETVTAIGGDIAPPPVDVGGDGGDDESPDKEIVRRLYRWVQQSGGPLLQSVLAIIETISPVMHLGRVSIARPAGAGSDRFGGEASFTASWTLSGGDALWGPMEAAVRSTLLKSDLWKALGVDYRRATEYVDNHEFLQHVLRALGLKLAHSNHAAYWLHLVDGKARAVAQAQLDAYLGRAPDRLVGGHGQHDFKYVPGSLKLSSSGKPQVLGRDQTPAPGEVFHMAATVEYGFTGQVDALRGGTGAFDRLYKNLQLDIIYGLVEAMELAWDALSNQLEVELNPSGGQGRSAWEPGVGPDYDPTWSPRSLRYTLKNWSGLFESLEPAELAAALADMPRRALRLAHCTLDCSGSVVDVDSGVECEAALVLDSARLDKSGLTLTITIADIIVG